MQWTRLLVMTLAFLLMVSATTWAQVRAPQLKWKEGGCYSSWCETGWYSSPAVADLDKDGIPEVIASAYSVVVLDGRNGSVRWRVDAGKDRTSPAGHSHRTWPGIWVVDVDNDNALEIITAHGGGYVSVYNQNGYFESGWPKRPTNSELRGLFVSDLDRDGTGEIIVTGAVSSKINTWVFEHNGALRSGWPQVSGDTGYAYGVFNDNAWVADLDGSGNAEVVVPSDVHYITAFHAAGTPVRANSVYGNKYWGQVGVWENLAVELRGWGQCNGVRSESYRSNFAHGPSVIADVDNNGTKEVVVTGNMYNCAVGHPPGKYTSLFIFNADRSRFNSGQWNWSQAPVNTGAPLSESYSVIENCQPNPVVADIDNNGVAEILFSGYDGRVHAFWLDKTEHGSWPFSVYKAAEGFYRFASEPVVADLDNDGCSEVIFTSWPQNTSSGLRLGKLHVVDCNGQELFSQNLPGPKSASVHINGALAAPTIADIDGDADYELVINTMRGGFVAYDLPGSAGARILWKSGRNRGPELMSPDHRIPAWSRLNPAVPLLLLF
ncbi:FG-GAP repeat domain-containing protein [Desulfogranum japonicum]|uniref:FG-GAP repeat domain-containing protein n=1 Tax=Desulfogranum japonicum TaxID=231447 RepID=UPI00040D9841|nr:VCBS repeat-containing protein [Desulfogranum japonicum]